MHFGQLLAVLFTAAVCCATALLSACGPSHGAADVTALCGEPPRVDDLQLKANLDAKAQLLLRYVGDVSLSGKIEESRKDVFSKYKDGEERNKYYLQHTLCVILLSDTSVSTEKKVELLRGIDADFRKPLIIDSYIEGPNVNFGCEESNSSTVRYQAPPDFHLVNAFASVSPDTTGTKHTSAEITDRSSVEATAVAKFQGQDRVFFNCPGGGHGAIRLTYQIASN